MTGNQSVGSGRDGPAAAFTEFLAELKERGSLLLLAGPAQHTAVFRACSRLLGESAETRRSLFVQAGGACSHRVPQSTSTPGESARALHYRTATRSAAASHPGGRADVRTVDGDLDALRAEIATEFDRVDAAAGGLDPAELRVCLDSLDALLATHDEDRVFRFLHGLSGSVRDERAMCHVHLQTGVDAEQMDVMEPLFDAVVEVRDAGRPQQRWCVPDEGFSTGWLAL
jgi:hypothetical protein